MLFNAIKELKTSVQQYREVKRQTAITTVECEKAIRESDAMLAQARIDHDIRMKELEEERKAIRARHQEWQETFAKEQAKNAEAMAKFDRSLDFLKDSL